MNDLMICLTGLCIVITAFWATTPSWTKMYKFLSWVLGLGLILLAIGLIERMIFLFTAF
ncbi:hypothetical protein DLP3_081 [Stenotrophomonas phage vB_SmaS_DLP_3]|nr:hypothetical protein DLP3_081 [Stenotrophomonas phage vB_SmaS_DLP_3]